eukprot:Hpha_TRINITY_DN11004_c0_g1::TRINITY_DN11004_c0_g1_i1::g.93063::m.93063/K03514/PAPD5_7, TRF4; non-canonical poly(A) RNA polymerase PAPD5/7
MLLNKRSRGRRSRGCESASGASDGASAVSSGTKGSHRSENAVSAPWYPQGVPRETVSLSRELQDFAVFMSLSPEERRARDEFVAAVTAVAQALWPGCTTSVYGSFAQGTSSPSSAVDILICGVADASPAEIHFGGLGEIRSVMLTPGSGEGFLQIEAPGAVVANVLTQPAPEGGNFLAANETVAEWLHKFPQVVPVLATVRHVLTQACADCVDVAKGGLSPFTLLVMVVHACSKCGAEAGCDEVLLHFLQLFGHDFQFAEFAVGAETQEPRQPLHAEDQVAVIDPLDAENNLAAGCSKLRQIKAYLQSCLIALRRWESEPDARERTPMSMIVSHQPLWARCQQKGRARGDTASQTSRGSRGSYKKGLCGVPQSTNSYVPVLYVPVAGADGAPVQFAPVAVLPQQGRLESPSSFGRDELVSLGKAVGIGGSLGDAQSSHGGSHGSSEASRGSRSVKTQGSDSPPPAYTAAVAFRYGRSGEFGSAEPIAAGAMVVTSSARGQMLGQVVTVAPSGGAHPPGRGRVLRVASSSDTAAWERVVAEEAEALRSVRDQVLQDKIPITVHAAEYQFDRRKITFHYSSPLARPPFQSVLHEMYRRLRCRIWMNNCNPRDGEPGEHVDPSLFGTAVTPPRQQYVDPSIFDSPATPPYSPPTKPEDLEIPPALRTPPESHASDDLPPQLGATPDLVDGQLDAESEASL